MFLMQYNEIAYCVFLQMRYNNIVIKRKKTHMKTVKGRT